MQGIGAQDEKQLERRLALLQGAERVDAVAWARAVFFNLINAKSRLSGNGQGEHLHAPLERGHRAMLLVRRPGRGDEQDFIKGCLITALLGQDQMSQMYRIEGAAEYA